MSVTLKDVAEAARVSVSTASRALGGGGLASERTQQRLMRIARELGYRPNPIARGLKTGQSRLVGLLIHNLTNASFQVIAEVVQTRLKAIGYQMLLCIAGDDPRQEKDTLATLADHRVDGLIVVPTGKNGAALTELAAGDVPVVCVVRRDEGSELETVLANDPQGAHAGTRYLIGLGHRRIGLVVGRQDATSGRERLSGYVRALREADIPIEEALIHVGHFEPATGAAACRKFLDLAKPPSAIFVANHESALGVLRVIAERGVSVPGDLSLLCYEDTPWFEWHRPAISVVDSGARELANLAVDRLLHRIEAKRSNEKSHENGSENRHPNGDGAHGGREYRVGARLVKRDSCASFDPPSTLSRNLKA